MPLCTTSRVQIKGWCVFPSVIMIIYLVCLRNSAGAAMRCFLFLPSHLIYCHILRNICTWYV